MRFARIRALMVVGVLVVVAGIATWIAIAKDTQAESRGSSCPSGVVLIETDPEKIPPVNEIEVEVLNATDRSGLANQVKNQMEDRGFTVVKTGDTDMDVASSALVIYGPDQYLAGIHVKSYFYRGADGFQIDWEGPITVIIGDSFEQVQRTDEALRTWSHANSITPPPGTCSIDLSHSSDRLG